MRFDDPLDVGHGRVHVFVLGTAKPYVKYHFSFTSLPAEAPVHTLYWTGASRLCPEFYSQKAPLYLV